MLENKNFFYSKYFLCFLSIFIIALSIFLRSIIDIGSDTGVYLDLGKKVFLGKKYYYDFFESNFPISFYFYALQYWISLKTHISQIILSEIFINLLALLSILWSAKILQKSTISENRAHYNLLLISYFLGFFLRPYALQIGEFGTKTSLVLILLYPYISFSFPRILPLSKKDLTCRGILMGLMPCVKPHYLILILPIEIYRFSKLKSLKFLFEIDKLVMALVGSLMLLLMVKFTPEYFEFIPSMWKNTYRAYDDYGIFLKNSWHHLAIISQFALIFLIFARIKFSENDKILSIFFFSATLLIILESIGTVDQMAVFYAVATICFLKFVFDLLQNQKNIISNNLFIVFALIFLPIFDMEVLPAAFLGLGGFINLWWLLAPYYIFHKNKPKGVWKFLTLLLYCAGILLVFGSFKVFGAFAYVATNLMMLLLMSFIFERQRGQDRFSSLSIFVIFAAITTLLYCYISSITGVVSKVSQYTSPNEVSEMIAHYDKKYAPNNDESFLMNSIWIAQQFPFVNYLKKDNFQKFHVVAIQADQGLVGSRLMFDNKDPNRVFTYSYLFDDVKKAINNPKVKVMFFNNSPDITRKEDRCLISTLEYYFLDPFFKKNFLKKFRFENHVIVSKDKRQLQKIGFISREKSSIFDQVIPSDKQIFYDFEVYVRN